MKSSNCKKVANFDFIYCSFSDFEYAQSSMTITEVMFTILYWCGLQKPVKIGPDKIKIVLNILIKYQALLINKNP